MSQQTTDRAAENAELLAGGYAAFGRGDIAALGQLFSSDVIWHAQRLGVLGGDHRGWPEVLRFFGQSMEMTQGTFAIEVLEILANDAGAAAVIQSRGRRGDRVLDDRQIHHFHFRDGQVAEVWQFVGDGQAVDTFWS